MEAFRRKSDALRGQDASRGHDALLVRGGRIARGLRDARITHGLRGARILGFNLFECALILVVTAISGWFFLQATVAALPASDWGAVGYAALDLVAAFAGICSVVLCAKGKRSGFVLGLINVVGYSAISYHNAYLGEVMLNLLFYVPSNICAYVLWSRHLDESSAGRRVKARRLTRGQLVGMVAVVVGATVGYHFVLEALGGAMTMLDGATTVLSIFATVLMTLRYAEQWLLWIVVDVLTVALWVFAADPVMIAMWSAYLVNAVYGYVRWLRRA